MLEKLLAPFKKVRTLTRTKFTAIETLFGGWLGTLELSKLRDYESYLRAGSQNIWVVWKCCDRVASKVMETPRALIKRGKDGTGQPVKIPELDDLLLTPNPYFNLSEMIYQTVFHLKLTGNGYWIKDQPNLAGDRPKALFVANPKAMRLVINPKVGVVGYIYNINGYEIPFDVEEVMHFRKPHPNNEYYGIGEIEAGEGLFQDWLDKQGYMKKFWARGASPSGIMSTKEQIASEADLDRVRAKWEQQYGGSENSGKTAFLTGDWAYTKFGLSMDELQHVDSWRLAIESICQMMGVPLSVFGVREAANYATAEVSDVSFGNDTVKPVVTIIGDTLNSDLIAGYGDNLELLWRIQGLINSTKVRENYGPMFDRGVLNRNEMREQLGLARVEDDPTFDEYYILSNYVPVDLAGMSAPPAVGAVDAAARSIIDRSVQSLLSPARAIEARVATGMDATLVALRQSGADLKGIADRISQPPPTPPPPPPAPHNVNIELALPENKSVTRKVVMKRQADGALVGTVQEEPA